MKLVCGAHLFTHSICPFAQRAHVALIELGSPLTSIVDVARPGLGDTMQQWYKDLNPEETVPSLFIHSNASVKGLQLTDLRKPEHGRVMLESLDICKYFDAFVRTPEYAELLAAGHAAPAHLYPVDDAVEKKNVDDWLEAIGDAIGALYDLLSTSADDLVKRKSAALDLLAGIEARFAASERRDRGPFFLGDRFSLADVALAPFLDRFRYTIAFYIKVNILEDTPLLAAMLDASMKRPSFRLTSQEGAYYIDGYRGYVDETMAPKFDM